MSPDCPICKGRGWLSVPGFDWDARTDCHCTAMVCNASDCPIHREPVPFTDAQTRQIHVLRTRGWTINIRSRDEDTYWLSVTGTDQSGSEFSGVIDARGTLSGEPTDLARMPEWFALSAPAVTA